MRRLADEFEPFRSLLIRHEQVLFAQSQQSAACNASHSVEARMCRWLLYMRDLAGSDELMLTQEFLAQMLSVRRPSVSIVANPLQKAGLIKYSRGHIRLLDVKGLKRRLRVLRHGQGPLQAAPFGLDPISGTNGSLGFLGSRPAYTQGIQRAFFYFLRIALARRRYVDNRLGDEFRERVISVN